MGGTPLGLFGTLGFVVAGTSSAVKGQRRLTMRSLLIDTLAIFEGVILRTFRILLGDTLLAVPHVIGVGTSRRDVGYAHAATQNTAVTLWITFGLANSVFEMEAGSALRSVFSNAFSVD